MLTRQIRPLMANATAYRPRYIVVTSGTNDAIFGYDIENIRSEWRAMLTTNASVIVTLPPLTENAGYNVGLIAISEVIREVARENGVAVVDLNPVLAPNGVLLPQYSSDGVHLTSRAYEVWAALIRTAAETRMAQ